MKIYKLYDLRPRELKAIHDSLGGKYGFRDRLARDGTGSPRLYYLDGHPEIDELRNRATDELRINFEEFQNGLMAGIAERTNPYILPLRPEDIRRISIILTKEKIQPGQGSVFGWLLRNGVKLSTAQFFARPGEHEESRTDFVLQTEAFSIHCWTTAREFKHVKAFFEKSCLRQLVNSAP
jgi:hypothetical protein